MRKTDGLTKAIAILLFAAMFCYMGFAVARRLTRSAQTALAVEASVSESAAMSGLVIRREEPVLSDREYIDVTARDGEKLAAGGEIATVYTSPAALDRAMKLHELETELAAAESAPAAGTVETAEHGAVYDSLTRLARTTQSGRIAGLDLLTEELGGLLMESPDTVSADYLRALKIEYETTADAAGRDSETLCTDKSGVFCRLCDGFEDLTPEAARTMSPAELTLLMEQPRSAPRNSIGKLVSGSEWYYAARMDAADAARLTEGQEETLSFGRYCARPLRARVEAVGAPSGGECTVLFALDEAMGEMLGVRKAAAELVFESYEGIRVPMKGLCRYYAGWLDEADAGMLKCGEAVRLVKGTWSAECVVSEIGGAEADGDGRRCLVVVWWPWAEDNAPPDMENGALVTDAGGPGFAITDRYETQEQTDCCCVFTMTGLQAERRRVVPVYGGEEYCLVRSTGDDALRAGNEVIVKAEGLYDGKVFD